MYDNEYRTYISIAENYQDMVAIFLKHAEFGKCVKAFEEKYGFDRAQTALVKMVTIDDLLCVEKYREEAQKEEDHVYVIGDFCFRNGRQEQWYVKQLKGHKHLILGNHDIKIQANEEAMSYFESVDQITIIKDGKKILYYVISH